MNNCQTEEELVAQARQCPDAFGRLYDQNYSAIFNYALRRTGNVELAEDITAATFAKALEHIRRFEWRGSSFSTWLYRIAGNELASYFRKGSYKAVSLEQLRQEQGFEPVSPHDLEAELIAAQKEVARYQEFLACQQAISQLPLKYQEVISLRFFAGKSHKEIAEIVGKPEGTVKSLLHRGLERLRDQLKKSPEKHRKARETATHFPKRR
jgi:RNA polymerase sigma-70 factor (ECF subfamily)